MKTTLELDVEVEYTYIPEIHAYTSGPPENCHPGSPEEAEITRVTLGGINILNQLTTKQLETLEAECCEDARSTAEENH